MGKEQLNLLEFIPAFEGEAVNTKTLRLVKNAGLQALVVRSQGLQAQAKSSKEDIVTQGDLAVSTILKQSLAEFFPGIIFVDEETASTHEIDVNVPGFYAVIDPIDGTTNYFNGDENWGVSVGFIRNGEVIGGIIYQPEKDRLYYAERGQGAFMNEKPLRVSEQSSLRESNPIFDYPYPKDKKEYEKTERILSFFGSDSEEGRVLPKKKPVRLGSQVIETIRVAEGEGDFFFHLKTKSWDMAAAIGIVCEAGGRVSNAQGEPYKLFGENIILSNSSLDLNPLYALMSQPNH